MASQYCESVSLLLNNKKQDVIKAANTLIKIARNIESNPNVPKYKSIQVGSRTFMEKILPVDGATQCLFEMGFVEKDDRFVLLNEKIEDLQAVRSQLENVIRNLQGPGSSKVEYQHNTIKNLFSSESSIYSKLESHFKHVLIYENLSLQKKCLDVIPIKTLDQRAEKKLLKSPTFQNGNVSKKMDFKDCLLLELLNWFKNDFFSWTDSPRCTCFNGKTSFTTMLNPTSEELKWGAQRVEGHRCNQCNNIVRFPRYNHPEKLLETRTGRCGEWANCFTLLCRSLGYQARHVIDWTDHVWTEVYSDSAQRWLHCDPCENICDQPLLYEKGWGKKLSLVVAVSCEEIVDVSWRYSNNINEMLKRRSKMLRESWLREKLTEMRQHRMKALPADQRSLVEERWFREMVQFTFPKSDQANVYGGRTTGSLKWREARGELGMKSNENYQPVLIKPKAEEIASKQLVLHYFSVPDKYIRKVTGDEYFGWESLTNSNQNIMRKEEQDWRTVYLARSISSQNGHISWKIDSTSHLVMKEIELLVTSTSFHSGKIKWLLCTESATLQVKSGVKTKFFIEGASIVSLHAFLSGGDGNEAWQHAQLFRERMEANSKQPQLSVEITFLKK